ncbi:MAG: DnaJ C-terminal domain-containing protein [Pseudomonadota bacterium]
MEYKDYYAALGISKDATQDDVKRAYRKLARKFHPDLNKDEGAEARFKEIGEANDVLSDPEKRAAYDQLGTGYQAGQDFRPPPDWDQGFEYSGGGQDAAFSEFFEHLFGRGQRTQARQGPQFHASGQDHHARVSIELEDAFSGATRAIQLKMPKVTADGHVTTEQRTLNVNIPKGVQPGQHIRLKGQGAPGLGQGQPGDLYLEVEFAPHRLYRVEGKDVYLDLPVAPWEAALGGKIKAPTPLGVVDISIPANSAQGRKLRLRGRGIPGKTPGDFYAVLQISLPAAKSEKSKEVYQTMARELSFNPRAALGV